MKKWAWLAIAGATVTWGAGSALAACGGTEASAPSSSSSGGSSTSSTSSSSSSGGSSSSSGGTADAGDSASPSDGGSSSGISNPNKITCGTTECNATAQKCCTPIELDGSVGEQTCISFDSDCQGLAFECDEAADCAGAKCCFAFSAGTSGSVSCQASCQGGAFSQVCKTGAECAGGTCTEYTCFGNKVRLCAKPPAGCN